MTMRLDISIWVLLAGLALAWAAPGVAEEIPENFTAVRPIGMGDAFTAVANDENAVWTNPAGVGRVRKARSRAFLNGSKVPNLIIGANAGAHSFYSSFKANAKDVAAAAAKVSSSDSKPFWARMALFPVMLFNAGPQTPMAFGVVSNNTIKAVIDKETPDQARIEAISDQGALLTASWTNQTNRFNVGVTLRPTARFAYEDRVPSAALTDKTAMAKRFKDDANKSTGLGIDAGVMYTIADFWFPTVGVAVLNLPTGCHKNYLNPFTEKRTSVCGNVYRGNFGNEDALSTVDPTDFRIGVSITPRLGRTLNMRLALDVHQLPIGTDSQSYGLLGIEANKLIHAGVELFAGNPLVQPAVSLRAGYSQGFPTLGASFNFGLIDLEFAGYGRDVSSTSTPVEDVRYLASLSMGF